MKKLLHYLFYSKIIFFAVASLIILSLNLTPLILQASHSPPGRTFALIHNNVQDFFFYQSLMNEGASGQWLTTDPYTSETHQSSLIFSYFLWLGKIARLLNLPYAIIYHLLRISLSIIFLFIVYYFLFLLKIPYPRLTYFFFLFASPFMHTINDNGKIKSVEYMYWWTGMDPIRRVSYLPHHILGALGLVISLMLIIKYSRHKVGINDAVIAHSSQTASGQKNPKIKYIILLSIFAILLAFIHTPSLFIILIILPPSLLIYFFYQFLSNKKFLILKSKFLIPQYTGLFVYLLICIFSLLFMVSQTNHGFPWSQYIEWEKRYQFPLYKELIGALGILTPFAFIGLISAFLSKKFTPILIACWLIIPILLIPFAKSLGISNIRLIQGVPYLPLSILASLGINSIFKLVTPFIPKNKFSMDLLLHCCIVALFIIFTLPTLSWSLADQIKEFWPIYGNVYLDNRLTGAFNFININFPPRTITLATFYTGNYLPAFTHTTSFIGHTGYTYNLDEKQNLVNRFFEGKMALEEAKSYIKSNKIALIFQGPEEKPIYPLHLYPDILKPVYDKEEVTIYIPR